MNLGCDKSCLNFIKTHAIYVSTDRIDMWQYLCLISRNNTLNLYMTFKWLTSLCQFDTLSSPRNFGEKICRRRHEHFALVRNMMYLLKILRSRHWYFVPWFLSRVKPILNMWITKCNIPPELKHRLIYQTPGHWW